MYPTTIEVAQHHMCTVVVLYRVVLPAVVFFPFLDTVRWRYEDNREQCIPGTSLKGIDQDCYWHGHEPRKIVRNHQESEKAPSSKISNFWGRAIRLC